jgi:hypothetical protein
MTPHYPYRGFGNSKRLCKCFDSCGIRFAILWGCGDADAQLGALIIAPANDRIDIRARGYPERQG